jgi:protein TonB
VYRDDFAARIKADRIATPANATAANAQVAPHFPGGQAQLAKYIEDNVQYPQPALDNGVEGTVNVSFAVDEYGNVYSPSVKGDKLGYGLEAEAIDVVKKMPKWAPGKAANGKNIKTYYDLPITFSIL